MRLSLAIASFVALIVHGIVFYDQFFHRWERYQTAYFDQARTLSKDERERAALDERRPRIEQIYRHAVRRHAAWTAAAPATSPPTIRALRSTRSRFEPTVTPQRWATYQRNGRWERRHKFADFGCTVCHDGQGRGLKTFYSHGEDPFWPEPMLGFVTQSTWRKEFAPKLMGAAVHGSQLRPVPHRARISPARPT